MSWLRRAPGIMPGAALCRFAVARGEQGLCLRYRGSLGSSSGCLWRRASLTICLLSSIEPIERIAGEEQRPVGSLEDRSDRIAVAQEVNIGPA